MKSPLLFAAVHAVQPAPRDAQADIHRPERRARSAPRSHARLLARVRHRKDAERS